ncbi:hypothetical protein JCM8208_005820 [Rhodotorula glutinis]
MSTTSHVVQLPPDPRLVQLDTAFTWLGDKPLKKITAARRAHARASKLLSQADNRNLTLSRTRCAQVWTAFLPAERERILDSVLAAYCWSRADPSNYNWDSASEEDDSSPFVQVEALVHAIALACPAQLSRDWATLFLSTVGMTRCKMRRLEPAAQHEVVYEMQRTLFAVHERLIHGLPVDHVLLTADAVLARAHDLSQPFSARFSKLIDVLDCLVVLYRSSSITTHDAAELEQARALLDRKMPVGGQPVVLERRVAEVHFADLAFEEQVVAVEQARSLLYVVCGQHHAGKGLPDSRDVLDRFFRPLRGTPARSLAHGRRRRDFAVRDGRRLDGGREHEWDRSWA